MAVSYDRIARAVAFTLETKSPKIFQHVFLNNGILAMFGSKGRVKIVKGGNKFDERINLGQNTNVAHMDKFGAIPTAFQDNWRTAQYGHAVIAGSVPINLVEIDQNAGEAKLTSLAEECIENLQGTFANKVADALMATSEADTDPLSVVVQLPATAFGSQTQTTGGLVRSDYPGSGTDSTAAWQTQYSSPGTAVDLSGAAGIGAASAFVWACSPGGSALSEQPDLGITRTAILAKASGAADVLRRFSVNDKMLKLGFDNIMINNAAIIADRNATANAIYFINTNYAHIQVLAGPKTKQSGSVKVIGDGAVEVPIQVCEPIESYDRLNYVIKAYMVYNLTFGGLRNHGRLANITEA